MDRQLRSWLTGLFAGLFAFAILLVPAMHTRAMLERTALIAIHAMPVGTAHEIRSGHGQGAPVDGHREHLSGPACLACVIMAAPGLTPPLFRLAAPTGTVVVASTGLTVAVAVRDSTWAPHSARAPPAGSIV